MSDVKLNLYFMKKVYAIKEVVGDRFLEKAKDSDATFGIKYVFVHKSSFTSIETFETIKDAEAAYAQYREHHSFTPFILQEIFIED